MSRAGRLLAALLAAAATSACRSPQPPPEPAAAVEPARGPAPPPLDPGSLDQVAAVAVAESAVFLAGEAGVVRLDPVSGSYLLLPEAEAASSEGAVALALEADGTLWSGHRAGSPEGGGLRRLRSGEGRPEVWLRGEDVAAVAVSARRVVAAAAGAYAELDLDDPEAGFERRFESNSRRLEVVSYDEEGARLREVIEFRPRGERVLALALAEPFLWIGTTHGLYRLEGERLRRYEVPCRVDNRPPRRVHALSAREERVSAVLAVEKGDGDWRPGGLLELEGEAAWRCHEPDVDVPDSPALAVDEAEGTIWLATYEGPTRIRDADAELFDEAAGAPALPASAVAAISADACWFGTWGGGVWRLEGREWIAYGFGPQPAGSATITRGALR